MLRSSPERRPHCALSLPRAHGSLDLATQTRSSLHGIHGTRRGGPTARLPVSRALLLRGGISTPPGWAFARPTLPGTQPWQKAGRPAGSSLGRCELPPVAPSPPPPGGPATGEPGTRVPPAQLRLLWRAPGDTARRKAFLPRALLPSLPLSHGSGQPMPPGQSPVGHLLTKAAPTAGPGPLSLGLRPQPGATAFS